MTEPAYAPGHYQQFDPAGWTYANAITETERAAAATELDARIQTLYHTAPTATLNQAETTIRTADRNRAQQFLRDNNRPHLIPKLGSYQ